MNVLCGSNTIGGNKILLSFDDRNVLLDFGLDFKTKGAYCDSFLGPRPARGIHDYVALGLLPKLRIYREDQVTADFAPEYATYPKVKVDALFISHAHMDHTGMAGFLNRSIPFVANPMTLTLMKAIEDTSSGTENETAYIDEKQCPDRFVLRAIPGNKEYLARNLVMTSPSKGCEDFLCSVPTATKTLNGMKCRAAASLGFETRCWDVDHSIYGAAAHAINTSDGWVVYTGDLRFHGKNGALTEKFVEEASKLKPLLLIIEGTRTSRKEEEGAGKLTEEDVGKNCLEACRDADGLIVADFGPRNFERLESFAWIANEVGRELVVTAKDAYFLDAMSAVDGTDRSQGVRVFRQNKARADTWEKNTFERHEKGAVGPAEIKGNPDGFIVCHSIFDLPHLLDIMPEGGTYLYSGSGSFDEEQDLDFGRLDNWIKKFGMRTVGFEMMTRAGHRGETVVPVFTKGYHASGHASKEGLLKVVERIRPEYLLPVHTESPEFFAENISCVPAENVLLPTDEKDIVID